LIYSKTNMQTIILSAGVGSRLRPYTKDLPKCLVKLGGTAILEHQLTVLQDCGISKKSISIVGGYLCEKLRKYNIKVFENKFYQKTNMVFSLFVALNNLNNNEDIIISYGDIVYEKKVLKKLIKSTHSITIVADKSWKNLWDLRMDNILNDAETFRYDSNLNILEIGKKAKSIDEIQAQYIGLIKIKKEFIKRINKIYQDFFKNKNVDKSILNNMYMTSFIENLINKNLPVKACLIEGGWLEVDTTYDLEIYNELYKKKELSKYCEVI